MILTDTPALSMVAGWDAAERSAYGPVGLEYTIGAVTCAFP
jgi:hypothetical protein